MSPLRSPPLRSPPLRSPFAFAVLLLSFPGVNVVSAADYAGEMGPINNYGNPRAITGRSGLFPSRYQSDRVDRANGPLVRRAIVPCAAPFWPLPTT